MTELLVILVLGLLVLGPKKLPELARSLGKGLQEFRRASTEMRREFLDVADETRSATNLEGPEGADEPPDAGPPGTEPPAKERPRTVRIKRKPAAAAAPAPEVETAPEEAPSPEAETVLEAAPAAPTSSRTRRSII